MRPPGQKEEAARRFQIQNAIKKNLEVGCNRVFKRYEVVIFFSRVRLN